MSCLVRRKGNLSGKESEYEGKRGQLKTPMDFLEGLTSFLRSLEAITEIYMDYLAGDSILQRIRRMPTEYSH